MKESDTVDHVKNHQTKVMKKKKKKKKDGEGEYEKGECDSEEYQSDENGDEEEEEEDDDDDDVNEEEEDLNDEEKESLNNSELDSGEDDGSGEKQKSKKMKKSKKSKKDRSKMCDEQKISKVLKLFSDSLTVTLESEKTEMKVDPWPEFHTKISDWKFIDDKNNSHLLPEMKKSISVKLKGADDNDDVKEWRRFKIFDSESVDGECEVIINHF